VFISLKEKESRGYDLRDEESINEFIERRNKNNGIISLKKKKKTLREPSPSSLKNKNTRGDQSRRRESF
jgi:deoxycytidine triphosphate deaminase